MFITAEIGINHNGDIELAKKLINVAIRCGCDAVKFQKRTVEKVYSDEFLNSPRVSPWGTTQHEQKMGLEFGRKEYDEIDLYCRNQSIPWYASAWDIGSQIFLRKYNAPYNKIASKMITDDDLLEMVAREGKQTFISTGMGKIKLIKNAVEIFGEFNCPLTLMHCVPQYPCPPDACNLGEIEKLRKRYGVDEVGYSCHCPSVLPTTLATLLGAVALEKHITLDRSMYGTDQPASLEERGLYLMVRDARAVKNML